MDPKSLWRLIRVAATFAVLIVIWFLFSGSFTPGSIAAGVVCAALIALTSYDTFIDEHEAARHMIFPRIVPALAYPFIDRKSVV